MKRGVVMYWAGTAVAFALGWLVTGSIYPPRGSLGARNPALSQGEQSTKSSSTELLPASERQVLKGEELEVAIRGISALANESSEEDGGSTKRLFEFARRIPVKEFSRALDQLRKPGSKRHDQLRAELLGYWMELNAPAAREYLTALPIRERARLIDPAANAWARMDSEGLMNWLKNLPSNERQAVREMVRNSVAQVLSQRDPALAVSLLLESPEGENGGRGEVEKTIFSLWGKQDPVAAAQRATLLSGGSGRLMALHITMDQWVKTDPAAAMAWVREIPDPAMLREAGIGLVSRLMRTDSEAAVKFAVEQGFADDDFFLRDACKGWVERDSAGALAWAQGLPSSPSRDVTLAQMLENVAKTQPQTAAQIFAAEAGRGANVTKASEGIIAGLARAGDGKSLESFLEYLPESERRHLTERATAGLVDEVAPAQMLSAGLQLPSGPLREAWLEESVYWITVRRGLKQTRQVLETLPAGSERDSLVARAVLQEFDTRREIEDAVALAQTLPNGRDYIKQGAAGWLKSFDATAARDWLRQTRALTEDDKQQLLQRVAVAATTAPQPPVSARPAPKNTIPRP